MLHTQSIHLRIQSHNTFHHSHWQLSYKKIPKNNTKCTLKVVPCAANQHFTAILKYSPGGISSQTAGIGGSGFIYFVSLRLRPRRLHKTSLPPGDLNPVFSPHFLLSLPFCSLYTSVFLVQHITMFNVLWSISCPGKGSSCRYAQYQKAISTQIRNMLSLPWALNALGLAGRQY